MCDKVCGVFGVFLMSMPQAAPAVFEASLPTQNAIINYIHTVFSWFVAVFIWCCWNLFTRCVHRDFRLHHHLSFDLFPWFNSKCVNRTSLISVSFCFAASHNKEKHFYKSILMHFCFWFLLCCILPMKEMSMDEIEFSFVNKIILG